jgi:hypothetical protein
MQNDGYEAASGSYPSKFWEVNRQTLGAEILAGLNVSPHVFAFKSLQVRWEADALPAFKIVRS